MVDRNEVREEARGNRGLAMGVLGVGVLIGIIFVGFLIYYTVLAPERVAAPTDIADPSTTSEGVAVPDGGDLTNTPNQAAPDSPARTLDQVEQ